MTSPFHKKSANDSIFWMGYVGGEPWSWFFITYSFFIFLSQNQFSISCGKYFFQWNICCRYIFYSIRDLAIDRLRDQIWQTHVENIIIGRYFRLTVPIIIACCFAWLAAISGVTAEPVHRENGRSLLIVLQYMMFIFTIIQHTVRYHRFGPCR